MTAEWMNAALPTLATMVLLIAPGLAVIAAGWGIRRPELLLLSPALSVALIGASAVLAPLVGLAWSPLPVAAITLIAAGSAYLLRRWAGVAPRSAERTSLRPALIALALAAVVLVAQFAWAFGSPENIAQRFDNIVHLNSVRYALETANASPFNIGATSDIGFYPSAWHAITSLCIQITGVSVPVGVNSTNLALVGLLWPASTMALATGLYGARRSALFGAAAFSTAFGAFPALFFNWGVLYPNVVGYAMLPATLAAVVHILKIPSLREGASVIVLGFALVAGNFLAHPNSFLAMIVLGGVYAIGVLVVRLAARPTLRSIAITFATVVALALTMVVFWSIARTPPEHSGWPPTQNPPQAFGEAVLFMMRGFGPPVIVLVLVATGIAAVARAPRLVPVLLPFAAAIVLFVVAAGFPIDHALRQWLTNPWYNDANRLAALLPIAAIPVATLGVITVATLIGSATDRRWPTSTWTKKAAFALAGVLLFTIAINPNVTRSLGQVREAYSYTDDSLLLSADERALLARLADNTPEDALIIGSPRTGTSLSFALTGRDVVEMHVFGERSATEGFLDAQLRDIETDPAVCAAIEDLGVTYVLDFGRRDILDNEASGDSYNGVQELSPSDRLVLVDSEGSDARLFRIEGC